MVLGEQGWKAKKKEEEEEERWRRRRQRRGAIVKDLVCVFVCVCAGCLEMGQYNT